MQGTTSRACGGANKILRPQAQGQELRKAMISLFVAGTKVEDAEHKICPKAQCECDWKFPENRRNLNPHIHSDEYGYLETRLYTRS